MLFIGFITTSDITGSSIFGKIFKTQAASVNNCYDSDNGLNPDVRGVTTNLTSSRTDRCLNSTIVYEYECSEESVLMNEINCDRGKMCAGGACITY